jgi:hypothetical protein
VFLIYGGKDKKITRKCHFSCENCIYFCGVKAMVLFHIQRPTFNEAFTYCHIARVCLPLLPCAEGI